MKLLLLFALTWIQTAAQLITLFPIGLPTPTPGPTEAAKPIVPTAHPSPALTTTAIPPLILIPTIAPPTVTPPTIASPTVNTQSASPSSGAAHSTSSGPSKTGVIVLAVFGSFIAFLIFAAVMWFCVGKITQKFMKNRENREQHVELPVTESTV